jgi:hypothetical protein
MSSASLLQTLLQNYADQSGDLDLRTFIGTPGYRIEVRNETVDTGQGYTEPAFVPGLLQSIGSMLDRVRQDEFDVTNPLGQSAFTLTYAPRGASHLLVFQDGALLRKTAWSLAGTSLTLATAAPMGAWLLACYWY